MTMKSKLSVLASTQGNASALMICTLGDREGFLVQRSEHRIGGEQPRHLRIEIHQRDAFDLRVFENFAHGQTVSAAENQAPGAEPGWPRGRDGSAPHDSGIRRAN